MLGSLETLHGFRPTWKLQRAAVSPIEELLGQKWPMFPQLLTFSNITPKLNVRFS